VNRTLLFFVGGALILGGAAVLGVYWWNLRDAAQAQQLAKESLSRATARPIPLVLPEPGQAARHAARRGDILGELNIPRLHMSVVVFEGDDLGILRIGAGHIPSTALPLEKGNVGIAAHRDTFFGRLQSIHPNDLITVKTPAGTSKFSVTETEIVVPTKVEVLTNAPGRDLTLVTCYPFSYIGRAPQRFIVHARRIE